MSVRTKRLLMAAAIVLAVVISLVNPWVPFGAAVLLFAGYLLWEWVTAGRVSRR